MREDAVTDERTYTSPEVAEVLGVSYRQIDYWIRRLGWRHHQAGSGSQRVLTEDEVAVLRQIRDLRAQIHAHQTEIERLFRTSSQAAKTPKVPA